MWIMNGFVLTRWRGRAIHSYATCRAGDEKEREHPERMDAMIAGGGGRREGRGGDFYRTGVYISFCMNTK